MSNIPQTNIFDNDESLTEPEETANAFNKYFVNVSPAQNTIMLTNRSTFFTIGSNSITTKIFKLLINDALSESTDLFNFSFSRGVFPLILKTSKVIPVYKKDSKLKRSNYRPKSLQSNIKKVLERFIYNCLYNFLEINCVICDFQFGSKQIYLTPYALIH